MATATPTLDKPTAPRPQVEVPAKSSVNSYFRWKGAIDRVLAAILLVPGVPIMAIVWLAVRISSPGPAIFRQERVGRNGRNFVMVKFRTMIINAEAKTGAVWAVPNDPRLTRTGAILRKMHLDELPQLWNVLMGEMSLVGPRPERPELVPILAEEIPGYMGRLAVPPGITGLAQVNLPPDADFDSVRRKLALDIEYIKTARLWLDLRLLCYSGMRMLGVPGLMLIRGLRLGRDVTLTPRFSKDADSLADDGEVASAEDARLTFVDDAAAAGQPPSRKPRLEMSRR